jgi:hypothetical protein
MGVYINHHVLMTGDVETIKTIIDNHLTPTISDDPDVAPIDFNTVGVHGFCLYPELFDRGGATSPFRVGLEQKYHSQMGSMDEFINALRTRYPTVTIEAEVVCDCLYNDECSCGRWTEAGGEWILDETKRGSLPF